MAVLVTKAELREACRTAATAAAAAATAAAAAADSSLRSRVSADIEHFTRAGRGGVGYT